MTNLPRPLFLFIVSVACVMVAGYGLAHPVTKHDSSGSGGGALDVKRVTQDHEDHRGIEWVTFEIEMSGSFDNGRLYPVAGEHFAVVFSIDNDRDPRFDRHILVASFDGSGSMPYVEVVKGPPHLFNSEDFGAFARDTKTLAYGLLWRPDDRTLKIRVPSRSITKRSSTQFRWRLHTVSEESDGQGGGSIFHDYVPDEGTKKGHTGT